MHVPIFLTNHKFTIGFSSWFYEFVLQDKQFHVGDGRYQMFQLFRSNLCSYLAANGISFWMLQADTYWRENLFDVIGSLTFFIYFSHIYILIFNLLYAIKWLIGLLLSSAKVVFHTGKNKLVRQKSGCT